MGSGLEFRGSPGLEPGCGLGVRPRPWGKPGLWVQGRPLGAASPGAPEPCPLLSSPVLVAEVVKFFFPAMVQLHSFVPASSTPQKLANWGHLNRYQGGQHCQSGAGPQRAVGSRSPAFMHSGMQIWILL